jgi:hypothetical protein
MPSASGLHYCGREELVNNFGRLLDLEIFYLLKNFFQTHFFYEHFAIIVVAVFRLIIAKFEELCFRI